MGRLTVMPRKYVARKCLSVHLKPVLVVRLTNNVQIIGLSEQKNAPKEIAKHQAQTAAMVCVN